MISQHTIGLCNITERLKPKCYTKDLPYYEDQLVSYKMLSDSLVGAYAPFQGTCIINIYQIEDFSKIHNITFSG